MHYPLASPIHGGGGPRKRWKGLASGDNASYSFLHHSGGSPFGGWRHHLARWEACHWILSRLTAPYSTAITDSLDSQVASAPLRIQFAGVTPVPLPPRFAGALWVLGSVIIWLSYGDAAGSACREAAYKTYCPKGNPQPSEPSEPSEPFEPGPRSGPYNNLL